MVILISPSCHGTVTSKSSSCHGAVTSISPSYLGTVISISQSCHGTVTSISPSCLWYSHFNITILPWYSHFNIPMMLGTVNSVNTLHSLVRLLSLWWLCTGSSSQYFWTGPSSGYFWTGPSSGYFINVISSKITFSIRIYLNRNITVEQHEFSQVNCGWHQTIVRGQICYYSSNKIYRFCQLTVIIHFIELHMFVYSLFILYYAVFSVEKNMTRSIGVCLIVLGIYMYLHLWKFVLFYGYISV
jgi:hypothetical protein